MPSRAVIFNDSHGRTIVFVEPLPCRRGGEHVTSKRTDAALRVLQWELDGHGNEVLEAMLAHPDMNLAEAVVLIERENPEWTEDAPRRGQPEEAPEARARRTREADERARPHRPPDGRVHPREKRGDGVPRRGRCVPDGPGPAYPR